MANQGDIEGFIFDCFERRHNLKYDAYPHNSPTSDYEQFTRLFRGVAEHPTCKSFEVPHLPLKIDVSNIPLPYADWETDQPPPKPLRGKLKSLKGIHTPPTRIATFPSHFLVSVRFESRVIYMLYRRYDVYLVGLRDAYGTWWEFSRDGGQLFDGTRPLGFSESYRDMGDGGGVRIGYHQLVLAFNVFADPPPDIDRRKYASQVMIAFSSEAGRSIILANKFSTALTDENRSETVELGGVHRRIMTTWSSISKLIIRNCMQQDGEISVEEAFPNYGDVVHELVEGEMIRVQDADKAYGLLIWSSDDPKRSITLDGRKSKSKVSSSSSSSTK